MTYLTRSAKGNNVIMDGLALNNKDQKAIEMLSKLLSAARRAQTEGKDQALSKIINEASRLSSHLNEKLYQAELANAKPAGMFYTEYISRSRSNAYAYTKVRGEIIE